MNDAPVTQPFAYDEVAYPLVVTRHLTPDRLRAAGLMRGWSAPPAETASFLEIGCGIGINAIALAATYPQSRCVGFDLAATAIERGRAIAAQVGIGNVELEHADITTYPLAGEKFDYIVCHGVHSWVPEPVQAALMRLIGARLAPGGVAYLGYDCLPTAAVKMAINRFLIPQVSDIADIAGRVDRAIEVAAILAASQHERSRFHTVLDHLVEDAPTYTRSYVYHDWLAEHYHPRSLQEVATAAEANGLRFAGDATLNDLFTGDFQPPAQELIERTGDDLVARNVVVDMLRGTHSFHTDLFVRADAPPPPDPDPLPKMTYSVIAEREDAEHEGVPVVSYRKGTTVIYSTDKNMQKVLDYLISRAPDEATYEELLSVTGFDRPTLDATLRGPNFVQMAVRHATPQPFVTTPGDKPLVNPLARAMLADGAEAVSLRHEKLTIKEDPSRLLLALSNGERTRAEIAALIEQALEMPATVAMVDSAIKALAPHRIFLA